MSLRVRGCRAIGVVLLLGFVLFDGNIAGHKAAWGAKPKVKAVDAESPSARLVTSALQAELLCDEKTRTERLQEALSQDPDFAAAHWHLGEVRVGKDWLPLEEATTAIEESSAYSQYRERRQKLDGSEAKELAMARWCGQQGMHDRAQFHYARLLFSPRLKESTKQEAVKKLELVEYGGYWRSKGEVEEMQADAAANEAAWKKWEHKFVDWRKLIDGNDKSRRTRAAEQLQAIDDVHITPLVEAHLMAASESWALELVSLLAKFSEPPATSALTRCAVLLPYETVRNAAIAQLKKRKLHDFVPQLLTGLSPQTRMQFMVSVQNDFSFDIRVQTETEDLQRKQIATSVLRQQHVTALRFGVITTDLSEVDPRIAAALESRMGVKYLTPAEANLANRQSAQAAQKQAYLNTVSALCQLQYSAAVLAMRNRLTEVSNAPFFDVLEKATGQKHVREVAPWGRWWTSYNEVSYEKPTVYYTSQSYVSVCRTVVPVFSCFLAGTPVATESGAQPIEKIRPGDRVLAQNPNTGELAFKLVYAVTVTPQSKVRKIKLGDNEIVTTPGHPLWVNGIGWQMAKELQPGQHLHTLSGNKLIDSVEDLPQRATVYNMSVADFDTYFVGTDKVLVHDNIYRQPTSARVPGLLENRP